jgi:hypothetical protein
MRRHAYSLFYSSAGELSPGSSKGNPVFDSGSPPPPPTGGDSLPDASDLDVVLEHPPTAVAPAAPASAMRGASQAQGAVVVARCQDAL